MMCQDYVGRPVLDLLFLQAWSAYTILSSRAVSRDSHHTKSLFNRDRPMFYIGSKIVP